MKHFFRWFYVTGCESPTGGTGIDRLHVGESLHMLIKSSSLDEVALANWAAAQDVNQGVAAGKDLKRSRSIL